MCGTKKLKALTLGKEALPRFLSLQDEVIAFQEKRKRDNFFKPRYLSDLTDHTAAGMPVLGVEDSDGKLVAQCLLTYPEKPDAINVEAYPLDGIKKPAVLQSFLALPGPNSGYQTGVLFAFAKQKAEHDKRTALVIQVVKQNKGVIRNMRSRNGFEVYAEGYDNKLNRDVVYLKLNLQA